mmetsp:Transcript_6237/g.19082  ORF Transcript_6237/g.19082 Transcript_6237/m.19082 type:complete len:207 (+) Transcript_6237:386-1006(+)
MLLTPHRPTSRQTGCPHPRRLRQAVICKGGQTRRVDLALPVSCSSAAGNHFDWAWSFRQEVMIEAFFILRRCPRSACPHRLNGRRTSPRRRHGSCAPPQQARRRHGRLRPALVRRERPISFPPRRLHVGRVDLPSSPVRCSRACSLSCNLSSCACRRRHNSSSKDAQRVTSAPVKVGLPVATTAKTLPWHRLCAHYHVGSVGYDRT